MVNRHDQLEVHNLTFHACVVAVANGFPHLPIDAIINPPHPWFDAALARQVVIHLMVNEFHIPKRRVVLVQQRTREGVNRGLKTIDIRLQTPAFEAHYRRMAVDAQSHFNNGLQTEAA